MQLTIFSVFDSKAEAFIQPFFSSNLETGKRMFATACNEAGTGFFMNAGDYTLFELGTFEQDSAQMELHKTPINRGLAISFKRAISEPGPDTREILRADFERTEQK